MITQEDIVEIIITSDILESAKSFNYPINKRSYMNGERHDVGAIGEIVVKTFFESCGYIVKYSEQYDYDLLVQTSSANLKIDVKTKKRTPCGLDKMLNYQSKGYEGSVQAKNLDEIRQKDVDIFTFVNYDGLKAFIVGYISKKEFIEKAFQIGKGKVDITNNLIMVGDNFNIYYKDLNPMKDLIEK